MTLVTETNRCKGFDDVLPGGENTLVSDNELKNGGIFFAPVNVVLNIKGANLIRRWEALDLTVGDGAHEGRLSSTVLTAETIAMATLETENGGVEQDLGTISQGELAVAKVFAFLLIFGNLLVVCALSGRANDPLTSDCDRLRGGSDEGEVRSKGFPRRNFEILGVDEVGSKGGRIDGVDVARGDLGTQFLVDLNKGVGELTSFSVLERGEVRTIALGNLADLAQGGDGTSDNTSGFWVTDGGLNLEETREKAWKERSDCDVRVDELGHVIDDAVKKDQ